MEETLTDNRPKQRTGALYIRVSTHSQDELSPDAQRRLLMEYALSQNIRVSQEAIFVESVSGRNAKKRQEFQRMIAMAKSPSHPFDVILVWKFSRFARNQEESIVYKSMLKKDQVDVISISEPVMDGPFGSLIERIIEWMDEYYSIRLSGEVLRGMDEKARNHGYQTTPPLGYRAVGGGKPFQINEEEFQIVSYIIYQYDHLKKDPTSIARSCNEQGYLTRRGNPFERRTVEYILKNPFYCGIVQWRGYSFQGSHEARFTPEEFYARQKHFQKTGSRPFCPPSPGRHWLSGLLRCSICGSSLALTGKKESPSFQCWKYARGLHPESCALSQKRAEKLIFSFFSHLSLKYPMKYKKDQLPQADLFDRERILGQIKGLKLRESRIREAYERGIDSLEEFQENKKRLAKKMELLKSQLSSIPSERETSPLKKEIKPLDLLLEPSLSSEIKGTFIRNFFQRLLYDKQKSILYFDLTISCSNEGRHTGS